jgi:hypothetical protein
MLRLTKQVDYVSPVTNLIRAAEAGAPDPSGVNVWTESVRQGSRARTVALRRTTATGNRTAGVL